MQLIWHLENAYTSAGWESLLLSHWCCPLHPIRLLLVEKAYCFHTAASLFPIFFNYRGEAQHKGTFLLLLQWPGIEPCKSALKLDTLTTDPLGTIYITVEISRSDKASVGGESLLLSYCCCPLSYFFQLQGWGSTQRHLFEAPSLTFYINYRGVTILGP